MLCFCHENSSEEQEVIDEYLFSYTPPRYLWIRKCVLVIGQSSPLHEDCGSFRDFIPFQDHVRLQNPDVCSSYWKPTMILLLDCVEVWHVLKLVGDDRLFAVGKSLDNFLIKLLLHLYRESGQEKN